MKSPEKRNEEISTLKDKLDSLGLPQDDPDVCTVYAELERYKNTGESFSGRIKLKNLGYSVFVKLSKQAHIPCEMTLKKSDL
jgi:hypothetical protein